MIRQGFGQGLGNDWARLGNGLDNGLCCVLFISVCSTD